jgi:hypothetical protein
MRDKSFYAPFFLFFANAREIPQFREKKSTRLVSFYFSFFFKRKRGRVGGKWRQESTASPFFFAGNVITKFHSENMKPTSLKAEGMKDN